MNVDVTQVAPGNDSFAVRQQQMAYLQRPRKQAQQFRSNSLTNKKDFEQIGLSGQKPEVAGPPLAEQIKRRQAGGTQQLQNSQGIRGSSKTKNMVKKEMLKRHESPRSRRQLINNLAGPQSYTR